MRRLVLSTLFILSIAIGAQPLDAAGSRAPSVHFRRLWTQSITPNADSVPALIRHVATRDKKRDVLYVLAGNNGSNCNPGNPVTRATLYALDAATGARLWSRSTSGPSRCTTAGPVADPSGKWVYAAGLDGKLHRYTSGSGGETRGGGWPETITLMPDVEKQSATPTIGRGYLYATTSGFIGDQGHYEGHTVTINLKTGKAKVFNSLCSNIRTLLGPQSGSANYCPDVESGLFGRGQGAVDPAERAVYVVSGNGPWNGHTNWGDSIMKLSADGSRLLDSFTPTDERQLEVTDADLGSTGPALLPAVKNGGKTYRLLVQGGKGALCNSCKGTALRLLNRDHLSGKNGPGHLGGDLFDTVAPGGCEVLTAPAVWRSPSHVAWVFYANDCGTTGFTLRAHAGGKFSLDRGWSNSTRGSTPMVAGGVLYVADNGTLVAYNPQTGAVLDRASIGSVHWQYPLVTDGRAYVTDENGHVNAFSVKG